MNKLKNTVVAAGFITSLAGIGVVWIGLSAKPYPGYYEMCGPIWWPSTIALCLGLGLILSGLVSIVSEFVEEKHGKATGMEVKEDL